MVRPATTASEAAYALRGDAPATADGKLPLVVFLSGIGSVGGLEEMKLVELAFASTGPFVLAAPLRNKEYWCLSQGGDFGFIDGNLVESELKLLSSWIKDLA